MITRTGDAARRIVVTGASRGLGLEFVRQWLERGETAFALARDPEASSGLAALVRRYPETLTTVACDVADDGSVARAGSAVEEIVDGLETVVNNAGVMGEHRGFDDLDTTEVRRHFEVNALGPLRIVRTLLPLLRRGRPVRRIVHMTSLMGSIEDNRSGDAYAYRMSKAALNMASRSLAIDLADDEIVSAVLHPGWVRTRMGGRSAPLGVDTAVGGLIQTIEALGPGESGGFYDREGKPLPW